MKSFRLILLCMLTMSLASCEKMVLYFINEITPDPPYANGIIGYTDYTVYGAKFTPKNYHYEYSEQKGGLTTSWNEFGRGLHLFLKNRARFEVSPPCGFDLRSDTSFFLINHRYRFDEVVICYIVDLNRMDDTFYGSDPPYEFSPPLSTFEFGEVEDFSYTLYFDLLYFQPAADSTGASGDTVKISGTVTHFKTRDKALLR